MSSMEQQISIKATGCCEKCPFMELELESDKYFTSLSPSMDEYYSSNYSVKCKHAKVCQMWEEWMVKAYKDWNSGVK